MLSSLEKKSVARVEKAIQLMKRGEMVILTDDEDRENEGDLVMAAEKVTPAAVNFMAKFGRGLICLSLTDEKLRQLQLPLMVHDNTSPFQTAFTISIEAARGVTTGISAQDRAHTILTAVAPNALPKDLVRPGHIFPLRAREGGVLIRTGQTEGSVDLARLAGLTPAGVICEIMNDDGSMARRPELEKFSRRHKMHMLSVADIITYRLSQENFVHRVATQTVERGTLGKFTVHVFQCDVDNTVHYAFVKGQVKRQNPTLVRVHRLNPINDVMDVAAQDGTLHRALVRVKESGSGVVVCLYRPKAIEEQLGLRDANEIRHAPLSAGPARLAEFGIGAQILKDVGVGKFRLLSNTLTKVNGLESYGLTMVDVLPLEEPTILAKKRALKSRKIA